MYRFVFSRRWLAFFGLCVLVAIGCGFLATWQWHRREDRLAANHLVETNYDLPPVALGDVLPDSDELPTARTWTPVQVTGHYVPEATTLVRNRPRNGVAGHLVLVPLVADGRVLLIDRGWVPLGSGGSTPEAIPAPPSGTVTVVARLRPPEPAAPLRRNSPEGQTYRKRPADLSADLAARSGGAFTAGQVIGGGYGQLATENPAPAEPLPVMAKPELDEGPHLSYSLQWVAFGVMALIGFIVVVRRTAEDEGELEPRRPIRSARTTDEDEEDALLDAQSGSTGS